MKNMGRDIRKELQDLKTERVDLRETCSGLNKEIGDVKKSFKKMEIEINDLKENRNVVNLDLAAIAPKLDELIDRVDKVEDEADKLESVTRRDNVRIYGVPEDTGETFEHCKVKILELLNEHVTKKVWNARDIVRAHRLSLDWLAKPRPIIVKFHHWEDK